MSLDDGDFPVELERRLTTFDEALSEVEDMLKNFQKVPYSDVCVQVIVLYQSRKPCSQRPRVICELRICERVICECRCEPGLRI